MADGKGRDKGAARDWAEAQRKYWDAWLELSHQAPEGSQPWQQALEGMLKFMGRPAAADTTGSEVSDRLLEQGRAFFQFGDEMMGLLRQMQSATQAGEAWQARFGQGLETLREGFGKAGEQAAEAAQGALAFWGLPLDTWRRVSSAFSTLPGDFLGGLKNEGVSHLHAGVERSLSAPALGYTREWQEQVQHGARLWLDYQKAQQDYAELLGHVNSAALERLTARLEKMAEAGEQVDNLRGVYDLWVDASEDAYAEVVATTGYAERHGRMVNALMAWKHHAQLMSEEFTTAANLPGKREMDTAHRRIQALRREVNELRETVATLQARIEGGTAAAPGGRTAAPARARPAAKKAASRRKAATAPARSTASRKTDK